MELWLIAALLVAGFVCGVMNALAGGGSFITFPLLMLAGLSPQSANATNRIAIILQCIAGSITYHRHGVMRWRQIPPLLFPSVAGGVIGSLLASRLGDTAFRTVSALLLAGILITVFVDPKRWSREDPTAGRVPAKYYPILFLLSIYGGFLQIGIGTALLAFFVLGGGYDVIRGNALKFGIVQFYQIVCLLIFAQSGHVDWIKGTTMAVGTVFGGVVGAHIVVKRGTRWVRVVVVLSAVAAIVKLLAG